MKAPGRPCTACPWVVTNTAGDIPAYDHDKAERLAAACPDSNDMGPDFGAPIFACHDSREGQEFACAGWLATVGDRHPSVRLATITGRLDPARLEPRPGWPTLHPTFHQVITKLRRTSREVPRGSNVQH